MKKIAIITLALVFGLCTGAFARDLTTGTISMGGGSTFSFESSTTEPEGGNETDTDTLELDVTAGYFLIDNLQIGLLFLYNSEEETAESAYGENKSESTTLGIEPFVQYHLPINYQMNAFVNAGLGFYSVDMGDDADGNGFGFSVGGGIEYFLIDSVALNCGVTYRAYTVEINDTDLDFSSLNIGAGVTVYFN